MWFAGVHSDVGGMFATGAPLSDLPLKWMAEHAVQAGLVVRKRAYGQVSAVKEGSATGDIHKMGAMWRLLGTSRRKVPNGAKIHASVKDRVEKDPKYAARLPSTFDYVDDTWRTPKPLSAPPVPTG